MKSKKAIMIIDIEFRNARVRPHSLERLLVRDITQSIRRAFETLPGYIGDEQFFGIRRTSMPYIRSVCHFGRIGRLLGDGSSISHTPHVTNIPCGKLSKVRGGIFQMRIMELTTPCRFIATRMGGRYGCGGPLHVFCFSSKEKL